MWDMPDHLLVLQFYREHCDPQAVESLGSAGGFSGASFWRVESDRGTFCLRRWPREHPSVEVLEFIQAVLWYVVREGFDRVPLPLQARDARGYVRHGGHLWELSPWMPGEPSFRRAPSLTKLRSAMRALAAFHLAAAPFPLPETAWTNSPGVLRRIAALRRWVGGDLVRLSAAIGHDDWPEMARLARRVVGLFTTAAPAVIERLGAAVRHKVPIQPCIRDIWHDHVFFEGEEVTGLIDFGAMQPENVAADVARLLGSLAGDDGTMWTAGIEAYQSMRPLSGEEKDLVRAFDASTVLLSGLNWLDWIYLQGRRFEEREAVLARVADIVLRLGCLAG